MFYSMVRLTKQKKILHEQIKKFKSFFGAFELHNAVLNKDKRIGLATVYRFLKHLETDGEIHSFMCDKKKIYSNNKISHAHFKCEKCKKIKHINVKNVDFLNEFSEEDICHFQIELTGLCSVCK